MSTARGAEAEAAVGVGDGDIRHLGLQAADRPSTIVQHRAARHSPRNH